MLQRIPHHQGHLNSAAQEAVYQGHSWDVVYPTPPLLLDSQPQLQELQSLTSFESDTLLCSVAEGKKKVEWGEASTWGEISSSVEQGRDDGEGIEPSFGFQTPFKVGTKFFDISNDSNPSSYFSTPGAVPMTDVTVGLATP